MKIKQKNVLPLFASVYILFSSVRLLIDGILHYDQGMYRLLGVKSAPISGFQAIAIAILMATMSIALMRFCLRDKKKIISEVKKGDILHRCINGVELQFEVVEVSKGRSGSRKFKVKDKAGISRWEGNLNGFYYQENN